MKTYTIGELLSAFHEDSYIGYCYKGDMADRIIICDKEHENRLVWVKPNGECGYDFYFKIADCSLDEARQYVFYHELDDYQDTGIKFKLIKCYLDVFIKEFENTIID